MTGIAIIALSIVVILQGVRLKWLENEVEAIKSWKPFVDICKIRIPEEDTK